MSNTINVLMAVNPVTLAALKDNLTWIDPADHTKGRVRENLTLEQAAKFRKTFSGKWNSPELGGVVYTILSLYVPNIQVARDDARLVWVEFLLNNWPNKFVLLGAWQRNGIQYGMRPVPATFDTDGNQLTPATVEGDAVYAQHPQALKAMPDDVTRDQDGNETGRTAALAFKVVHKVSGWSDRHWL